MCGGPVVPTEGVVRSNGELSSLVKAQRHRAVAFGWFAAAAMLAGTAVLAGGVALLVARAAHGAAIVLGVLAGSCGATAAAMASRGSRRNAEARTHLEEAWRSVKAEIRAAAYLPPSESAPQRREEMS